MNRPPRFDEHRHDITFAVWTLASIAALATPKAVAHIAHRWATR